MTRANVVVVKVGGSLLTTDSLPSRLTEWLTTNRSMRPESHFVLLVGGGKWVDAVRDVAGRSPLGDEAAHWISISLMNITANILAELLPSTTLIPDTSDLLRRVREPGSTIFQPCAFLRDVEPSLPGARLAHDWTVTSDSIAGRLAVFLKARELVLLKSAPPPATISGPDSLMQLAEMEYVDKFLPRILELPQALRIEYL